MNVQLSRVARDRVNRGNLGILKHVLELPDTATDALQIGWPLPPINRFMLVSQPLLVGGLDLMSVAVESV